MDGLMVDSEPAWFELQSEFAEARGGTWNVERDMATMMDMFVARVDRLELKAGLTDLLIAARARRIPCAVASSSSRRLVDATLNRFGIHDRFDAIVTGDAVARPKPAPDIFLEASTRLGIPPAACVVLEDSL